MQKLSNLIPPDVDVSPAVTAEILNRALRDDTGWFDPLKEPTRTVDYYEGKIMAAEQAFDHAEEMADMTIKAMKAGMKVLLPKNGDFVKLNASEDLLGEIDDEFGPITEIVFMNLDGEIEMMSVGEYNSTYGNT
jgi:hypothetical protein